MAIEPGQVHRLRVAPQGPFAAQVEVDVEITQRQLTERPINRLAITAPGEIRFRERSPMSAQFENSENVISVLFCLEIENERRKSENAECRGGEDRALQTMRSFFAEHLSRRPRGAGEMIRHGIEKPLNAGWC